MKTTLLNSYIAKLFFRSIKQFNNLTIKQLKPGFTLVELLIYMALLSIFLITLTGIFVNIMEVQLESDATSAVDQDGRFILSRLAYDINRANSISIPPQIGQTRSNLRMDIGGETYEYSESAGSLQLRNNFGTDIINGSDTTVSNISFQKIGNAGGKETIKIQFTITSTTQRPSGPETKTFTTTIGLR